LSNVSRQLCVDVAGDLLTPTQVPSSSRPYRLGQSQQLPCPRAHNSRISWSYVREPCLFRYLQHLTSSSPFHPEVHTLPCLLGRVRIRWTLPSLPITTSRLCANNSIPRTGFMGLSKGKTGCQTVRDRLASLRFAYSVFLVVIPDYSKMMFVSRSFS